MININDRIGYHIGVVLKEDPQVSLEELRRLVCLRCGVDSHSPRKDYDRLPRGFREWQDDFIELRLLYKVCELKRVSWDYQSSSDREWDACGRPKGAWDYSKWGSLHIGYSSALRKPRLEDVALIRAAVYRLCKERHAQHLIKQARARKEYGRAINARLENAGANRRIIDAYWSMGWRKECEPEEFVNYVLNDSVNWRLAAAATGWRLLEIAGANGLRGSVTRTTDLAKAVVRARGERPACTDEIRSALRSGVTVPQSAPGVWSF